MKIYLDYVFFINFLFDLILILGVGIILKRNTTKKRIILSSLFGALFSFSLFIPISSFLFFISKILSGMLMMIIAFSYKSIKYTFLNLIYLMILSIILGGSLYFLDLETSYDHVGMIFFKTNKSLNIIILLIISIIVIFIYIKLQKKQKDDISYYYQVDIYLKDNILKLNAFLDTGNNLYDPYFKRPVIIANKNIKILSEKCIFIPFETLNSKGILKCFIIDKIYIHNVGFRKNVLIAISQDKFDIDGVDLILHKKILGGMK